MKLPVIESGRPWHQIGVAETQEQATRVVKKHLGDHSKYLLDHHKFNLIVWQRTPLALELNGGLRAGLGASGNEHLASSTW